MSAGALAAWVAVILLVLFAAPFVHRGVRVLAKGNPEFYRAIAYGNECHEQQAAEEVEA